MTPAKVLGDGTKRVLVAASLSLGLLLPYYHPPGATAAQDPEACVKKCTKECNKIAPGSPGYCQETCEDECSFMAAEGAAKEEAEGKEMVTNLGFLGDDYVGNPLDNTLKQLFAGGKTGPTK